MYVTLFSDRSKRAKTMKKEYKIKTIVVRSKRKKMGTDDLPATTPLIPF